MSYGHGWAAICNQASDRIPRTEYGVEGNLELLTAVTGVEITGGETREEAVRRFVQQWDYSLNWHVTVSRETILAAGGRVTDMGHAVFASDGSDFTAETSVAYPDIEEAIRLRPSEEYTFFPRRELVERFERDYAEVQRRYPGVLSTAGVYTTLFSGLIEIYGIEQLLLLMGLYEQEFKEVVESYFHWVKQFFDAFAETSVPVMMVHDDLCWTEGPVTHPRWYRETIFPYLKRLIEPVKSAGKKVIFTSDGTIDEFFGDFVELGIDMLVMEPTSDLRRFGELYGDRCGMAGGIDCRFLTSAGHVEIEQYMADLLAWGKKRNNFILASGNHLPASVPVEKALFYQQMYRKYSGR